MQKHLRRIVLGTNVAAKALQPAGATTAELEKWQQDVVQGKYNNALDGLTFPEDFKMLDLAKHVKGTIDVMRHVMERLEDARNTEKGLLYK